MRPQRQLHIPQHHFGLVQRVVPGLCAQRRADRIAMRLRPQQRRQHAPGRGEAQIERPPLSPRAGKGSGDKGPIITQGDNRRRDHHLLARHPQGAGHHRDPTPAPMPTQPPRGRVEGQQIKKRHQQFGPLNNVVDALASQRMDQPQRATNQTEPRRRCAFQPHRTQCPPHQSI